MPTEPYSAVLSNFLFTLPRKNFARQKAKIVTRGRKHSTGIYIRSRYRLHSFCLSIFQLSIHPNSVSKLLQTRNLQISFNTSSAIMSHSLSWAPKARNDEDIAPSTPSSKTRVIDPAISSPTKHPSQSTVSAN